MIDWTDEAVKAAIHAFDEKYLSEDDDLILWRAALDAAVKAMDLPNTTMFALRVGREEALEEAAKVIENELTDEFDVTRRVLAAAIRALKGGAK
jgi:hypothetical protein